MMYLDVSPMIAALRVSPDQFEVRGGRLRHMPSRHDFDFDEDEEEEEEDEEGEEEEDWR